MLLKYDSGVIPAAILRRETDLPLVEIGPRVAMGRLERGRPLRRAAIQHGSRVGYIAHTPLAFER